ncbi:MAG: CRISPR-associated endonuclease Cas2 [Candidatus Brocadiae bacterium]|nr:CRISPR-associated endonuclease Cas2 [Candidatus Brocadiia bacterium]
MKKNYLIGYDISNEKRLTKVAKIVQGFGTRVQYSFFHCFLSEKQKRQLKSRLKKTINQNQDQIIILPITQKQLQEIEILGYKINLIQEGLIIV